MFRRQFIRRDAQRQSERRARRLSRLSAAGSPCQVVVDVPAMSDGHDAKPPEPLQLPFERGSERRVHGDGPKSGLDRAFDVGRQVAQDLGHVRFFAVTSGSPKTCANETQDRAEDDRRVDRHLLPAGRALAAASGSRLRSVRRAARFESDSSLKRDRPYQGSPG